MVSNPPNPARRSWSIELELTLASRHEQLFTCTMTIGLKWSTAAGSLKGVKWDEAAIPISDRQWDCSPEAVIAISTNSKHGRLKC